MNEPGGKIGEIVYRESLPDTTAELRDSLKAFLALKETQMRHLKKVLDSLSGNPFFNFILGVNRNQDYLAIMNSPFYSAIPSDIQELFEKLLETERAIESIFRKLGICAMVGK